MPDQFNIEVTFSGQNRLSSAANAVTQDLNRVTQSTRNTTQEMGRMESSVNRIRQALDVGIAGAMIGKVVNFAEEFNQLGTEVNAARETFVALNGGTEQATDGLESMRAATGHVVDDLTLMRGANQLLLTGLADSADQAAELTQVAIRLGGALGHDAADSMENLNSALLNNSFVRLDTLGISAAAVRERVAELTAAGLDMSAAFAQATLEQGRNAIEQLGDAATVAETPLRRMQTIIDNIGQTAAGNFTTGLNAIIGGVSAIAEFNAQQYDLANRASILLTQTRGTNYNQADLERTMQALRMQDLFMANLAQANQAAAAAIQRQNELNGTAAEQLDRRNERLREAARAQNALNALNERAFDIQVQQALTFEDFFAMTSRQRGEVGGQQLFSEAELARAQQWQREVENALTQLQAQRAAGAIIPEEDMTRAQTLADAAGRMADNVARGAEAFENLRLSEALGEGGGDPLLSDVNAAILQQLSENGILDEDALQDAADTFHLASGEITQGSITWRDSIVPTLARLAETQGAAVAAQRAGQTEDFMQMAALAGFDPNSTAYQFGLQASTGTFGGFDFQGTFTPLVGLFQDLQIEILGRQTETEQLGTTLAQIPGPTQAITDTRRLADELGQLAAREFEIKVNVTVNDPAGALSMVGGGNFGGGGSGGGGKGKGNRSDTDLRGRTVNNGMTITTD